MTNSTLAESVLPHLQKLGLTENDTKVYIFLLERGKTFASSSIATIVSLPRQYVHNTLKKLVELKLVDKVPSGNRAHYKALPPQQLIGVAREQFESAEMAVRALEKISAVGAEEDFEVYRGRSQVFEFEERIVHNLKENEVQYIIGGGADTYIDFFGAQYEELSHVAESYGLRTQYVGCTEELPWLKRARKANRHFEFRTLENLPHTIVQTVVRFENVTFYTFGTPPLVYIIKSKVVADDYKKFFDMLWNLAKE